mmetsp:Transcript_7078/g.8028  ORF Transcript_7078/g.8028 Transcript_7078/m.8028 type:complete len:206 (+) Transcript_7078:412-1029(+)
MVHMFKEENANEIYCLDFTKNGDYMATAGKDKVVRVYDELEQKLATRLTGDPEVCHGHSNRIFTLKFNPDDKNMLVSGGWDNNVFIWDIRQNAPVGRILVPNITGDSVDIHGNRILVGGYTNEDNLCLIDLKMQKIDYQIPWYKPGSVKDSKLYPPCVYSAKFSKPNADFIIAGGTQKNECRVFKNSDVNEEITGITSIVNLLGA